MTFFNRNRKPVALSTEELSDEARLVQLLDEYHATADENLRSAKEKEILVLIDHYFRLSIRPVMAKRFGPQMLRSGENESMGFTVLLHEFFSKVMKTRPDEFWEARTARDLRNWSSKVMANHMLDYLKRKKRGQEIVDEVIKPLYEHQKRHFEKRFPDGFDKLLEILETWGSGQDLELQKYANLLRLHYLFDLSWEDAAADLGMSKTTYFRSRDAALEKLRDELM